MFFEKRDACPICDNSDHEVLYESRYDQDPVRHYLSEYYSIKTKVDADKFNNYISSAIFMFCRCKKCNLIYQTYVPNDELLNEVYSNWIDGGSASKPISFKEQQHYLSEALRLVPHVLKSTRKQAPSEIQCLDYGMGLGGFVRALTGCGVNACGYDLSEVRQKHAKEAGLSVVSLDEIKNSKFDFINTEQVFEHLSLPKEIFRMLANSLTPGGILKISVPFSKSFEKGDFKINWKAERYANNSPMPIAPLEHLQYFTKSSLSTLSNEYGLTETFFSLREDVGSLVDPTDIRKMSRQIGRIGFGRYFRNYHLYQKQFS